ncbi:MAG: hypothetical protein G01um101444_475 [Parcubacteria group bacterium Gr01-1014_44]|nr:MAG: hypothetical protein G01um101444_475 [Parcubacteria group bacterium Gr01-1014_44]
MIYENKTFYNPRIRLIEGIAILVIIGGAVLIYPEIRNLQSAKQEVADVDSESSTKELGATIDTSTWKTYVADVGYGKYGFQFLYPTGWYVLDSQAGMGSSGLAVNPSTGVVFSTIGVVVTYGYSISYSVDNVETYSVTEKDLRQQTRQ